MYVLATFGFTHRTLNRRSLRMSLYSEMKRATRLKGQLRLMWVQVFSDTDNSWIGYAGLEKVFIAGEQ